MIKNIEVELRGPLDEKTYNKLIEYLDKNGEFIDEQNRFLLIIQFFWKELAEENLTSGQE